MDNTKMTSSDTLRIDAYKILSECFYKPDGQLLNKLRNFDASIGQPLCDIAKAVPDDDQLSSLTVDFSRLFVGPFKLLAPPYGSVYLDGPQAVRKDSLSDIETQYRSLGLDVILKESPDHIAIEFEFMYFLICKEVEAFNSGLNSAANDYRAKQILFLEKHLTEWLPEFVHNVELHAQTDFYKNIAQITKAFVDMDLKNLCGKI